MSAGIIYMQVCLLWIMMSFSQHALLSAHGLLSVLASSIRDYFSNPCLKIFSSPVPKTCPFYHFLQPQHPRTHWNSALSNVLPSLALKPREVIMHKFHQLPSRLSHCPATSLSFLSASQLPEETVSFSIPDRHHSSSSNLSLALHANKWLFLLAFFIHFPSSLSCSSLNMSPPFSKTKQKCLPWPSLLLLLLSNFSLSFDTKIKY